MSVLDRSELEASPLADLHAIADQLGLDGFRRLRKADLIDAILGEPGNGGEDPDRSARKSADDESEGEGSSDRSRTGDHRRVAPLANVAPRACGVEPGRARRRRASVRCEASPRPLLLRLPQFPHAAVVVAARKSSARRVVAAATVPRGPAAGLERRRQGGWPRTNRGRCPRSAEGVVELLGNGSAFLRVDPPEPSDEDVYISAAQVRRCELVSGDRVTGPVRTPRRSERYPSLVRIDTINGASADAVSEGAHYEDLPVAYPSERLALNAGDPTLDAIEWLTPLGRGSRAVIVGPSRAGKTETLRRLLGAVTAAPRARMAASRCR